VFASHFCLATTDLCAAHCHGHAVDAESYRVREDYVTPRRLLLAMLPMLM